MKLSEELEILHKYIYTSMDLPIPTNDFETRKQQLFNSKNKIIDPTINQQIFEILQEQIKLFKQSFDHVLMNIKQQPKVQEITNELPNDTKELQDQVKNFFFSNQIRIFLFIFQDNQITFIINN
jgi:excinuclease UvrABC helicase subunit UvrB